MCHNRRYALGTAVVDDATASGGKAVRIPFQAGSNGWSVVFSAPRMEMRGQVLFTFWLRAENLPPLTPGFHADPGRPRQTDRAMGLPPPNPGLRREPAAKGLHSGHPGP